MADPPPMSLPQRPPSPLKGRYHLIEQIGQGGMAAVYRAHDSTLDRDVAIKLLNPNRVIDAHSFERFMREARAVARLSHPNIVSLFDVDRDDPWNFLILEYIPGQDLGAAVVAQGGTFALNEALHILRGTLEALAYAHQQGIIHRDIKPRNIMMTPAGQVKVTDFGLALIMHDVQLTQEGMILGTMLYIPPEMVMGQPVDHRADLYAAGVVFYELLTGNPPFGGQVQAGLISQILNAPAPRLRATYPHFPAALDEILQRLLAKHPQDRFASATEVLQALGSIQEGMTTRPRPSKDIEAEFPQVVSLYAAQEEAVQAIEAERRRLAALLENNVVTQLDLLLAQASIYEQSLAANAQARTVASVLATLARQCLQQVRDLKANLSPAVLETLGLEPAIETLVTQMTRSYGLRIDLTLERMHERLPVALELTLFRAAQDFLERAVQHARASHVTIQLAQRDNRLHFHLTDNGIATSGIEMLHVARQRIHQLGGQFVTSAATQGGIELAISLKLEPSVEITAREREVLQLLVEGLSNKQIARALTIAPRTVNFHLDNIYSKLGVNSRTEAAIYALRQGWVQRPTPDTGQINR